MNSNHPSDVVISNRQPAIVIEWKNETKAGRYIGIFTDDGSLVESDLRACLSTQENEQAAALHDAIEHRHFIARRSFQRLFLSEVLALGDAPAQIAIVHKRDVRPICLDAPDLQLSFSSSGNSFIACASWQNAVGIDIERVRTIANVAALAKRFFTPREADAIAALPLTEQSVQFLYYWTAKEAALKAIGQGIVFGLNTFTVEPMGQNHEYCIKNSRADSAGWRLQHIELASKYVVALVEKNHVNKL